MVARIVAMLAILAIAVVTTVASAHPARMGSSFGPDHATHVGEMMHAADSSQIACSDEQHCGSAGAGMCEVLCAGLLVFLASPVADAGHAHGPASHAFPSEAIHVGRAPGLDERPPRPGLP